MCVCMCRHLQMHLHGYGCMCTFMVVRVSPLVYTQRLLYSECVAILKKMGSFTPWGHANGEQWRQRGRGGKIAKKGKKSGGLDWSRQGEGDSNLTATINCTDQLHGVAGRAGSLSTLSVWLFLLLSHFAWSVRGSVSCHSLGVESLLG